MPKELIDIYNSLSEVKQQEAYDFITYLSLRKQKRSSDEVDEILIGNVIE